MILMQCFYTKHSNKNRQMLHASILGNMAIKNIRFSNKMVIFFFPCDAAGSTAALMSKFNAAFIKLKH